MTSTQTSRLAGLTTSLAVKAPVKVATTANVTLSGEQTIDGVACVTGNRVLVKDQTDGTENGIYKVDTSEWARAKDFDGQYDVVQGTLILVNGGDTHSGIWRVSTADDITLGTTALTFQKIAILVANLESFVVAVSDEASTLTSGLAKVTFRLPYDFNLTSVVATLSTASSSGSVTFDINKNGSSILSTLLTIDQSEETSLTASVAAVVSDDECLAGDEITVDVDDAGTSASGAKMMLIGRQPL